MKKCPYCAEMIQDEAIKCRYCGSDVRIPPPGAAVPPIQQAQTTPNAPEGAAPRDTAPPPAESAEPAQPDGSAQPAPPSESAQSAEAAQPVREVQQAAVGGSAVPEAAGAARVGEGAIAFSHSGYRYILGYGSDFFGIWDRQVAGGPVARFSRTDEGWDQAWNAFVAWEPKNVEVPRTGAPPDARITGAPFASAKSRSTWTVALVALTSVLALVAAGLWASHIGTLHNLEKETVSGAQAQSSEDRAAGVEVALFYVTAAAGLAWLMWQHRAHRNLSALGSQNLRFTPGWVVGWWLIPFANIVMPPRAMNELWKASDPKAGAIDWKSVPTNPVLPLWWAAWLGRLVFFGIGASVGRNADLSSLISRSWWYVAGDIVFALAGVFAIVLVRGIQRRQEQKRARMQEWSHAIASAA